MGSVHLLPPHERMTPVECLSRASAEVDGYSDVIVVATGSDGDLVVLSSGMTRAEATFLLMEAVDYARGKR